MFANARAAAETLRTIRDGLRFADELPEAAVDPTANGATPNPLESYFDSVSDGPGIWKWRHYFPIYHRHLERFVGRSPHVLEIGICGGGSLPMWLDYFGDGTHVYGVDIEPECRKHQRENVNVFIGDQADTGFWDLVLSKVPRLDVVIDDGGHTAEQQITTLRCLLPQMAAGGVYICEDIGGRAHQTHSFLDGMTRQMSLIGPEHAEALPVHRQIAAIHRYPMVAVIEKPDRPVERFTSERRGTDW